MKLKINKYRLRINHYFTLEHPISSKSSMTSKTQNKMFIFFFNSSKLFLFGMCSMHTPTFLLRYKL